MSPRALVPLLLASLAACGGDNQPPSLAIVPDQQVVVGDSLVLVVIASDPDGDRLDFSAKGLPDAAQLTPRSRDEAVLTYSPAITDTQPGGRRYAVTLEAADGNGGVARQSFGLVVYPAFGVPTFDLPSGVVLNLAQEDDLSLAITVKDDDSTDVDIALTEAPEGAKLQRSGHKTALFHWRPSDAQRLVAVHRAVFSAQDEAHAPVTFVLTLVLLNAEKQAGCDGTPPTVTHHVPADAASSGSLTLSLDAADADSKVRASSVRWTRGDPEGAYQEAPLERLSADGPTWRATVDVGAPASGGTLVHYSFTTTDNDDPTGVACDQTSRTPKSGWFTAAIYPSGGPSGACVDDAAEPDDNPGAARAATTGTLSGRRMCGAEADVVRVVESAGAQVSATVRYEATQGSLALRLMDATGATLAAGAVTEPGVVTARLEAASGDVFIEVSASDQATRLSYSLEIGVGILQCEADAQEPNDSAATAKSIGIGVYADLRVCAGDVDFHRIATSPNQALRFAVAFDARYGDLDLELRGGDGTTVLATAASAKSVEELTYTSAAGGDVFLRVYGVDGARNGYTLTVSAVGSGPGVCPSDGLGDNRVPEDAAVLFQGVYEGFTVCSGAPDWFAVDLNGGETLDVLTEGVGGPAPSVAIYVDPTAGPVASSAVGSDGLGEASYTLAGAGRLYYAIETTAAQVGYAMLQDVSDPPGACRPDRFEPNGAGSPVPLDPGVTTWLRLCGGDDVDAFTLELPPFTVVTVITGHAAGGGYTDLKLLGPTGAELSAAVDQRDGAYIEVLVEAGGAVTLLVEPYEIGASGLGYDLAVFID
ncbi:MAG: hypothetical protein CVU56_00285 [Deltaproteobacteria bacterium HGW-Deltaproteobacteria-14]|jgi:hypothetical protein|nr:MAG: hypothetical protein CVU56_00285 [Deltaproteobacteria bacterium HGW-Deltaproteobacteria-14]